LPLAALFLVIFAVATAASLPGSAHPAAAAPSARACDRFAAPNGSDGNPGTLRSPFRTPERLVRSLAPGRTGCLRRGVYRTELLNVERGGRRGAPIRLRSFPGERARLVGIVQVRHGANHVVFSRLTFEGTGDANTIKIYARGVVVQRSNITNAWRGGSCMILGSDEVGAAVRTVVRRNRFHECGDPDSGNQDHSIYAANLQGGRIVDNRFWNHTAYAIHLYPNADRNLVARNVIDGGPPSIRGGILLASEDQWSSSGNVIARNVIAYATQWNFSTNWNGRVGSGNVFRHNCVWAGREGNIETDDGGVRAYGNRTANPRFVNRAARDYRLRAASRCRAFLRG
jgi:Right handed beta helix region